MREIKFRIWDVKNKKMIRFEDECSDDMLMCPFTGALYDSSALLFRDEFKRMQFTGLKDKNGKEIYEGDIVKAIHHDRPWSKSRRAKTFLWPIVFEGGSFIQKWDWSYGDFNHGQRTEETEVVGNIYENPELLENK